jgi:putative transposase
VLHFEIGFWCLVERIANTRDCFLHQRSAQLARRYSLIAVEKLQLQHLTASAKGTQEQPGRQVKAKAGLNRALLDVSAAKFFFFIRFKAERAGGRVVFVNPAGTSQECAHCAMRVPKSLSQRVHACPHCGYTVDRDLNAARNILHRAVVRPGQLNAAQ